MINQSIKDLGTTMGFKDLTFNKDNFLHLKIENIGNLYIEDIENCLLIYLAREIKHPTIQFFKRALKVCHFKERNPYSIDLGLFNENILIYSIRLSKNDVTSASILENCIVYLRRLHDQLKEN